MAINLPNIGASQKIPNCTSKVITNVGAWQGCIIDPPVIITQPQDLSVFEGNVATFTIAVTGEGLITYQWFKNDLAQPGETGTTYDFTTVLGDDGSSIKCVVTNEGGSTTSDIVTLTVIPTQMSFDKSNYFTRTQPAKSEEIVNKVIVKTQPLLPATSLEEIFRTDTKIIIDVGGTYNMTARYSEPPALTTGAVASLENATGGALNIVSSTFYPWGAELVIENIDTSQGEADVVIDGKPLVVQGEETIISEDETSITTNGLNKYEYPDNHLVQNSDVAQQIADALLSSYKTYRKDVNIVWRGNPALELGDPITVTEYQRGATNISGVFKVFKNKIDFDGTLKQITDGRKT